jgi:hypothetical protein
MVWVVADEELEEDMGEAFSDRSMIFLENTKLFQL